MNFIVRNCSERMLNIIKQSCKNLEIPLKDSFQGSMTSLRQLNRKISDDSEVALKVHELLDSD